MQCTDNKLTKLLVTSFSDAVGCFIVSRFRRNSDSISGVTAASANFGIATGGFVVTGAASFVSTEKHAMQCGVQT